MHDRETRRESLTAILENLNLNVHPNTIATKLKSFGLHHRIARKRLICQKNRKRHDLHLQKSIFIGQLKSGDTLYLRMKWICKWDPMGEEYKCRGTLKRLIKKIAVK